MKTNSKNPIIKLISLCGQIAEHKSEKMQENNIDESQMLAVLSEQEQEQLKKLLTKLQTTWISEHKQRMQQN